MLPFWQRLGDAYGFWLVLWSPLYGPREMGLVSTEGTAWTRRRWICQWLLIHYWNWSDVSVRATVTLNAVVANGMSLNVRAHVMNVKDSVKIATLMQAPMIQVNTNSYHEWHNCLWMTSYYVMVTLYHICNAHSVFLEFILNLCKLTTFPKTLFVIHL